jgi:hypothetical protein
MLSVPAGGRRRSEQSASTVRSAYPGFMNSKPSSDQPACPECGSRDVTDTSATDKTVVPENPAPLPRPVHVVRLKCKRGHVWSPA